MSLRTMILYAGLATVCAGAGAAGADFSAVLDDVGAAVAPSRIVLTRSEHKRLYAGDSVREYRVCARFEKHTAPLIVSADGKDWTLQPGDCEFVTGRRITATPARPLAGGRRIVVTFHLEKRAPN